MMSCRSIATRALNVIRASALGQTLGVALAQADLADPRFAPLFGNPDFALDPTDPRFAKAGGAAAVAAAVAKKRSAPRGAAAAPAAPKAPAAGAQAMRLSQSIALVGL